ncbi:secretin and TonB N-terminal domain-containing protein, partial [Pseudomonas coronafaciens]
MPRPASSLHPLALAVLMACAAMPLHASESSVPNPDITAARSFSIPAGDLGQVLNSFSEQAGFALAFDPALTRGKRSTGMQGTYSTDEAIARLLGGSGLRARALSANRYRIEAAPEAIEGSMELQATNISGASQFETATGPVTGYVATRGLSATKTDTALIETPQSISVVTKDQMKAQGAENLSQMLRYSAAVVPETRGSTASRLD